MSCYNTTQNRMESAHVHRYCRDKRDAARDGQMDGRTDRQTAVQLHTHSAGNSTRLRMMCPGAGSPLARGRACEAAGSEPAASAVEGRHAYTMQRRECGADELHTGASNTQQVNRDV